MTQHTFTLRVLALLLLATGLSGCASLPEWSGIAADSPANPQVEVMPYTPPVNPFASDLQPISAAGAGEFQHDGMVMYTCPMHPDVRSDSPGVCPKCGMKLTATKSGMKHDKMNGGSP